MKSNRLIAILGVAIAGTLLVAPQAASAAGAQVPVDEVPNAPMGLQQLRSATDASLTDVYWKPATYAARYRVKVTDGVNTVSNQVVPATQALTNGLYHLSVATPNKCSTYKITVRAEDAIGQGAAAGVTEKSLVPTIVTKARGYRSADRTKATFEMSTPQWKGYLVAPGGGAKPDNLKKPTISVSTTMQLVRLIDNKVINTATTTQTGWTTAKVAKTYTQLDTKRAYVLRVTTSNAWGSCSRADGRILINPVPA
ncbi:hypothetical protein ACIBSW_20200 [Actinoplanes sp. NPDC049668]|uniref:hypothetical protein n=1 Tax=unclassified Actinoplanes TaxID=2626549 RepID=UPI0033BCFD83